MTILDKIIAFKKKEAAKIKAEIFFNIHKISLNLSKNVK